MLYSVYGVCNTIHVILCLTNTILCYIDIIALYCPTLLMWSLFTNYFMEFSFTFALKDSIQTWAPFRRIRLIFWAFISKSLLAGIWGLTIRCVLLPLQITKAESMDVQSQLLKGLRGFQLDCKSGFGKCIW